MKRCDICGREAKAKSVELLKPSSEWEFSEHKEYDFIDLCYTCSTSILWHIRYLEVPFSEEKTKGVTNAERDCLLNDPIIYRKRGGRTNGGE